MKKYEDPPWSEDQERRLAEALASVTGLDNIKRFLMREVAELKRENKRLEAELKSALTKRKLPALWTELSRYKRDLEARIKAAQELMPKEPS